MQTMRDYIALTINGEPHEIRGAQAFMMLADYVRLVLALYGTKIVCAEGDCGACTVLCYRPLSKRSPTFEPLNACIATVAQMDGTHILTVESLKENQQLSPVQDAIVKAHGSQCGFCTPGFAMVLTALMQKARDGLSEQRVKNQLTGNLCRCTGYQTLIDAALQIDPGSIMPLTARFLGSQTKTISLGPLQLRHGDQEFLAPTNLDQAVLWLNATPKARLISGATDVGVMVNKGKAKLESAISLHLIPELYDIELSEGIISVGARVSLGELREFCHQLVPELAQFINIFASPQIKNMATLIGNIANGSPIADTLPFLMVSGAQVSAVGPVGTRIIPITELFKGYKLLSLLAGELITKVTFAIPPASVRLRLYKISQRRDLDIATVNGAFWFDLDNASSMPSVKEARIALGGVAARVVRLTETETFLAGQSLSPMILQEARTIMQQEITPLSDLRGSASFRRVLVDGMMHRFVNEIMGSDDAFA